MKVQLENPNWYAIYTRSRFEKKVYHALQQKGLEAYLPLIKEKRRWSDRIKSVEMPLLPSYVFLKANRTNIHQAYLCAGFVRFVSSEGKPCTIPDQEINLLKNIISNGYAVRKNSEFEVGERVSIIRGPLRGWEGRIDQKKGNSRIVFQFDSIQQSICVEVNASDIRKIRSTEKSGHQSRKLVVV